MLFDNIDMPAFIILIPIHCVLFYILHFYNDAVNIMRKFTWESFILYSVNRLLRSDVAAIVLS